MSYARSLTVLLLLLVSTRTAAADHSIAIGVPPFRKESHFLTAQNPAAWLVRAFTSAYLLRAPQIMPSGLSGGGAQGTTTSRPPAPFSLELADSLSVSADRRTVYLRLRANASFSNGAQVTADDVEYSTALCQAQGKLPAALQVERSERPNGQPAGLEEWVKVSWRDDSPAPDLILLVADCPILESHSSQIFESELGYGTNMISSGPYTIVGFKAAREVLLKINDTHSSLRGAPASVSLKVYADEPSALSALRAGSLDAIWGASSEAQHVAKDDETLKIFVCHEYTVIHRIGLEPRCGRELEIGSLNYRS